MIKSEIKQNMVFCEYARLISLNGFLSRFFLRFAELELR